MKSVTRIRCFAGNIVRHRRRIVIAVTSILSVTLLLLDTFWLYAVGFYQTNNATNTEYGKAARFYYDVQAVDGSIDVRLQQQHLQLEASRVLGIVKERPVYLTIGVPSVSRPGGVEYLSKTLASLTKPPHEVDYLVVVLVADQSQRTRDKNIACIQQQHQVLLDTGRLHVITPPPGYYDAMAVDHQQHRHHNTYNDSDERVKWRSKQVLDYVFLLTYCAPQSKYYLQLEDDVLAMRTNYLHLISTHIESQGSRPWGSISFSPSYLAIGRLFHCTDLPRLARFLLMFRSEHPVDILYVYFTNLISPTSEVGDSYQTPIFSHVGKYSTLANKTWVISPLHPDSDVTPDNPPADVLTDMTIYGEYTAQQTYELHTDETFFWVKMPSVGEFYLIILQEAANISHLHIATGSEERPDDYLRLGQVDVSKERNPPSKTRIPCDNFQYLLNFTQGIADIEDVWRVMNYLVRCVKVSVTGIQDYWLIIRTIYIYTHKQ